MTTVNRVVGKIVNVLADERSLTRMARLIHEAQRSYDASSRTAIGGIGEKVGRFWHAGTGSMRK